MDERFEFSMRLCGMDTVAAARLVAEIGDTSRVATAGGRMGYLGRMAISTVAIARPRCHFAAEEDR